MALTDEAITAIINRYERERDRYQKLVDFVHQACVRLVSENAIPATVQSRTKDPARLRGKLVKQRDEFDSAEQVFGSDGFKDFAGVRVATYVERDRPKAVREITRRFVGPDSGEVVVDERNSEVNFYRGTHCLVLLPDEDLVAGYENLRETRCEIQVCSLLAHVWNEIEHDRAYKPLSGELNNQEKNALESLGNLTRAGDNIIETLLTATDARLADIQGIFQDQWDFVARARRLFPDASDFGAHSGQLFDELMEADIDTPEKLRQLVGEDGAERAADLLDRLQGHLDAKEDSVVRVDPESSDRLLMLLLESQAQEVLDRHPAGRGQGRPPRIASVARRYVDMVEAADPPGA
jgi:ppGpp synthetase/RelA/SpoT-type nucleotidyltranferase